MDMLSKLKNFWFYHKWHLLIGLAVLAVIGYLSMQSAHTAEPDYHIGIVKAVPLSEEALSALEATFTAAGEDVNGDGVVLVQLHPYFVDLADDSPNAGVTNAQTVAALDADLIGKVSGIFLLENIEDFQRITNNMLSNTVVPFGDGLYLTLRRDAGDACIDLVKNLS